jgi:hypothetical protein
MQGGVECMGDLDLEQGCRMLHVETGENYRQAGPGRGQRHAAARHRWGMAAWSGGRARLTMCGNAEVTGW